MGLIILIVISAICWFFVFSKSVRQKMPTPWWVKAVARTEDDEKMMTHTLILVMALVFGLIFTFFATVGLVGWLLRR
ncbi:MAG TPA: hypothetical protein DC054_20440 [Blastocatellia bacterium]|nr:hypothetical protein [Blastocatellia bacterium]